FDDEAAMGGQLTRESILAIDVTGRKAFLETHLREIVAELLGLSVDEISAPMPLVEFGFTSMQAVRLQVAIQQSLQLDLSAAQFLDGMTMVDLAETLVSKLQDGEVLAPLPS